MKPAKKRQMHERYQTLYLYLQGTEIEQIAHTLNRSAKTVKGYILVYETGGIPGHGRDYESTFAIIDRLCVRL
ncbi:helix-turn-helix domain-containing protein [Paenibacillus sp. NPDC055715]